MGVLKTDTAAMGTWGSDMGGVDGDAQRFIARAPSSSEVQSSHGAIGFAMQNEFDAAHGARGEALGTAQADSAKISETLKAAARAYERGDAEVGRKLQAQAQRMENTQGAGGRPGGPSAAGGGQDSGAQMASQMMGQFSQMAGQVMQGVTQPVQRMMQGLSQLPQQVMQGVQGIVQTATQGAGGGTAAAADIAAAKAGAVGAPSGPGGAGASGAGEKAPTQDGIMEDRREAEQRSGHSGEDGGFVEAGRIPDDVIAKTATMGVNPGPHYTERDM